MGLELIQGVKMTQQLKMTPNMVQAIGLLQLSRLELESVIQEQLLENPLLEEVEYIESAEDERARKERERLEELALYQLEKGKSLELDEKDFAQNADWEDYLGDFSSRPKQAQEFESGEDNNGMLYERTVGHKPSLEGHLAWQIALSDMTDKERKIAELILGNLTSTGYLDISLTELAASGDESEDFAEKVLFKVQRLDPVGVAARTPQECLVRQLEAAGEQDELIFTIVEKYLPNLERNDFQPIISNLKITRDDLEVYVKIIRELNPMPGSWYDSDTSIYIKPDVYVYEYDGKFIISLNKDGLPELQKSTLYEDLEKAKGRDEASSYVKEKVRDAKWLIESLSVRNEILYRVAESIVQFQEDFFREGPSKLKPLILKEIAEVVERDESNISRITTNKYMATPFGIFEMKYFFNSALDCKGGEQVGSGAVKEAIKKIIATEDKKKPLSDEKIGKILTEQLGVEIARRTVNKYRTVMGISSASGRKKMF